MVNWSVRIGRVSSEWSFGGSFILTDVTQSADFGRAVSPRPPSFGAWCSRRSRRDRPAKTGRRVTSVGMNGAGADGPPGAAGFQPAALCTSFWTRRRGGRPSR
jgi:hypothetical protein